MMRLNCGEERRSCYRVRYPAEARPRLILENRAFEVTELCEGGMRFLHRNRIPTEVGDFIAGEVRFKDGSRTEVCGKIRRGDGPSEAVVTDLEGIPMQTLISEQRYLAKKFPGHGPP